MIMTEAQNLLDSKDDYDIMSKACKKIMEFLRDE